MKQFKFPLERVLEWRRTQARIEEARLQALFADVRAIEKRQAALEAHRSLSEEQLLAGSTSSGLELAALDAFRRFAAAEHIRLEAEKMTCRQRVAAQMPLVTAKHRDVRLLERLKEQRFALWRAEASREEDVLADELHRANLHARRIQ